MENQLLYAYCFLVFLFIGSFLNVVALRTLEGTSVLNPKYSHCPSCQTQLGWQELVPVFSWAWLGGKCRTCKQPISWIYPLGELSVALILTWIVIQNGFTFETLAVVVLFLFLLTVMITDIKAKLMPNKITYPGIVVLLFLRLFIHPLPFWHYALGFVVGGGVLTLLALVPNGMGGGDIKLFAMIGLGLGFEQVLFAFFFSCVWGTIAGLPLKWAGVIKPRQPIPFGPFILLGTLTAWLYGHALWQFYMSFYL
jgi:leader peptidase (prepilin peptidase) / N-methyltransferase